MKRATLDKVIDALLFEDVAYGIYDRPAYTGSVTPDGDDDKDKEITVPTEVPLAPIKPTEMMSSQLAHEKPPIEDDEYKPTSLSDLARASHAIAELVPPDQIDFFYQSLHTLLDDTIDKSNSAATEKSVEDSDIVEDEKEKKEDPIELKKESYLIEQWDDDTDLYGNRYDDTMSAIDGWDDDMAGFSEFEPAAEEMASTADDESPDSASLEQIAAEFGFSGAPGARQHIEKLTSRMHYFATKLNKKDVAALQDRAVGAFIEEMQKAELVDEEDIVELQQVPAEVKKLDSFRFFFVSAFVMPAYQEIQRDARKNVEQEIKNLGVPKEMQQTVLNQALGKASRDPAAITRKLEKVAAKLKMKPEEKKKIALSLETGFASLVSLAEPSEDLVDRALSKFDGMNDAKKKKLLKQALDATAEFQEG